MDPLRVVHLCAPAPFGGLETVVRGLTAGLAARGHAVTLVAVVEPHTDAEALLASPAAAGVEVLELRVGRRAYLRELRAIATLLDDVEPHVLHTHGHRPDLLHPPLARRRGIATVSTFHGFTRLGGVADLYEWAQVRLARDLDAAIAVSPAIAERLRAAGLPGARIHLVPNGWVGRADLLDRTAARAELDLPPGSKAIGWVGRLARIKGPDVFLRALARLDVGAWTACLIGDGPDRVGLEALARSLGLADRVRFLGYRADAGRLVRAYDLFALSSRSEGTPMALLEAMSAGVPVVATEVGGVRGLVRGDHEGWLVPPERPDLLARAIAHALGDPEESARRSAGGRERVRSEFGADAWLDRHEHVYRAALDRRPRSPLGSGRTPLSVGSDEERAT